MAQRVLTLFPEQREGGEGLSHMAPGVSSRNPIAPFCYEEEAEEETTDQSGGQRGQAQDDSPATALSTACPRGGWRQVL